ELRNKKLSIEIDDFDATLARLLYIYSNPPSNHYGSIKQLLHRFSDIIPYSVARNHYYRHLYGKIIIPRLIYRNVYESTYSVIIIRSHSTTSAINTLEQLYRNGILTGVDQINILSNDPFLVIAHVWISKKYLKQYNFNHEPVKYLDYGIYTVEPINPGELNWS
ncbi:MAG: hypothetical protein ABWW65_06740, partial [Thermoprotei archaeon]